MTMMKLAIVSPVAANLRHGVLGEDEDADDDDEDAADDAQQRVVLFDLRLEHRIEEQCGHGHEGVGARHADTRDDARPAAFRECALNAEHGHGADRDRRRHPHADTAEEIVQDSECHFLGLPGF